MLYFARLPWLSKQFLAETTDEQGRLSYMSLLYAALCPLHFTNLLPRWGNNIIYSPYALCSLLFAAICSMPFAIPPLPLLPPLWPLKPFLPFRRYALCSITCEGDIPPFRGDRPG